MDNSSKETRYEVINTNPNDLPTNRSEMLTVWRTLHVECDSMPYYNYPHPLFPGTPEDPTKIVTRSDPSGYLGLAISELERACVVINPIPPSTTNEPTLNVTPPPLGHNPLEEDEYNKLKYGIDGVGTGSGRDIKGNCKEFWTVRIVMASAYNDGIDDFAGVFTHPNTIVILYETIKDSVDTWNIGHPSEWVTLNASIERTVLHEICHLLIDGNERNVNYDISGNTTTDTSTIGVRDTIWRYNPNPKFPNNQEPDMKNRITYAYLLDKDIQGIQFHSKARD